MGETVSKQASPLPDYDRLPEASNDIDATSNHTSTVAESLNFSVIDVTEAIPAEVKSTGVSSAEVKSTVVYSTEVKSTVVSSAEVKSTVVSSADDKTAEEQEEEEEEEDKEEEHEEITDDNVEAMAAEIDQLLNFVTQDINKCLDEEGVRKVERLAILLDGMELFKASKLNNKADNEENNKANDEGTSNVGSINRQDGEGETLLHKACIWGRADEVDVLLTHPRFADDIDLNPVDGYGGTPFVMAHINSHTECIRRLLQHPRLNVNLPTVLGDPLFFYAACRGQLDIIKCWLMSGRDLGLTANGKSLEDVIQAASNQGHTEVVELLTSFQSAPVATRELLQLSDSLTSNEAESEVRDETKASVECSTIFDIDQSDLLITL